MAGAIVKKNGIDMLHGPLKGKILKFALPLAATGILQQLFNAADVAVVGQMVGSNAMAAVGSNSAIVGLFVNLFIGMSIGTNVVISRFTGKGDTDAVHRTVHTSIILAIICSIIVVAAGQFIVSPIHGLLGNPAEVRTMAEQYLSIYLYGMPVVILYNFESAIFRSQGDTRTPLICLVIAGIANVGLNIFFVKVVGMTASGVALATVISNGISSLLMFIILCKTKMEVRIRRKELKLDTKILKTILRIGMPTGIQSMVFSVSNMCIQSGINALGPTVMAASSAAFNVEIIGYYILNSFGQAATTFTGQNYGAGNKERCKQAFKIALIYDILFSGAFSLVIIIFARPVLGLFNPDEIIIHYGTIRILYIVCFGTVSGVLEVVSGALRGYGKALGPAIIALVCICGTRIIWVYTVFEKSKTFETLIISYPLSWIAASAVAVIFYIITMKKLKSPC